MWASLISATLGKHLWTYRKAAKNDGHLSPARDARLDRPNAASLSASRPDLKRRRPQLFYYWCCCCRYWRRNCCNDLPMSRSAARRVSGATPRLQRLQTREQDAARNHFSAISRLRADCRRTSALAHTHTLTYTGPGNPSHTRTYTYIFSVKNFHTKNI